MHENIQHTVFYAYGVPKLKKNLWNQYFFILFFYKGNFKFFEIENSYEQRRYFRYITV